MGFFEKIRNFFRNVPRGINLFHLVSLVVSLVALTSTLAIMSSVQSLQAEAYYRADESERVEKVGVLRRRRSWRYRGYLYYLRDQASGRVVVQRIIFLNAEVGNDARRLVDQLVTLSGWNYRNGVRFYADNIWSGDTSSPTPTPRPTPTPTQPPGTTPTATPRPTPTLTPTSRPTPTPTTPPGTGGGPTISIEASAYNQLKDYLLPGDHVVAGDPSSLASINKNEKGVLKGVIMRSLAELRDEVGDLPNDIDYVAYNMESFTPETERADPVGSVREFVRICHEKDLQMMYIPLRGFWQNQSDSTLKTILDEVDMIDYQAQKVLGSEGNECAMPGCPESCTSVERCINTVREISNKLRSIHPAEDFVMGMQIWVRRCDNPPDAMAQCINGLKGYVDLSMVVGIYSEVDQARQVLQSLDWR